MSFFESKPAAMLSIVLIFGVLRVSIRMWFLLQRKQKELQQSQKAQGLDQLQDLRDENKALHEKLRKTFSEMRWWEKKNGCWRSRSPAFS